MEEEWKGGGREGEGNGGEEDGGEGDGVGRRRGRRREGGEERGGKKGEGELIRNPSLYLLTLLSLIPRLHQPGNETYSIVIHVRPSLEVVLTIRTQQGVKEREEKQKRGKR